MCGNATKDDHYAVKSILFFRTHTSAFILKYCENSAIDQGEWGGPGSCASRLCECDQTLSKCLRSFYCPRKRAVCTTSPWRLLQNFIMEI